MTFVRIPAGRFVMGSPATEKQREAQERPHRVTLSRCFYLGVHEVTQRQWTRMMGSNPSHFSACSECPVERVTSVEVERFIARVNATSAWAGYRLPTEAEPVGTFQANAFGLFDMSGNVWEWTSDDHCPYPAGDVTDPRGACPFGLKVIRGGSWRFGADSARCALRYTHRPQDRGFSLGARLAHDAE